MSEFRIFRGNGRTERTENESENVGDLLPFPPPRTPFSEWNQNLRVRSVHDQDPNPEKIGSLVLRNHLMECLPFANRGTGSNFSPKARGKPHSEPNSAQNTPNRNAGRPSFGGFVGGGRNNPHSGSKGGNLMNIQRGISNSTAASPGIDVPHFALEEDGSFWMDHNVQVLIRIRPISKTEKEMHGYNRCLKQESGQTLAWVGNPETRFTFDHIAGETVTQDLLFRVAGLPMVENCMSGYNSCTFAYGQTGSGKTYTMMGELYDSDDDLSEERGLTPRIFEYLFARIKAEEFSRKDEHLKYSCKCSFLEIYNEQITDLLEPSSTNLQLREDLKEGVYVESLRDFEVETVKDVMELLFQGTANRKVAATSMNSESSRSHSVFTCVIESRWEKDAMTHFRFARLNLVDLAGSERQKSSGAEGERLKEAANINKSLSTLGLVIMTLVDVAHGKNRHVPYRDSRLTFLLQDSLGGNSKTTIIANVSPSICCANETLSTLKFAQRAKLIRNNAKVNEDASGDVMALQRQIQQLKDQLTFLEHQRVARPIPVPSSSFCYDKVNSLHENNDGSPSRGNASSPIHDVATSVNCHSTLVSPSNLNKKLEAMLVGSLRREKMAEEALVQLKAEIEQMNRLCNEKEDDNRRINTILRLRDEKIARFELPAGDLQPADVFLMEENNALREEIQLLQARIDRNPELTRFALENIRLIEQLRMYQSFYENGEKEMLLAEVSLLRNQVLEIVERKHGQVSDSVKEVKDIKKNIAAGFETNTRLAREVQDLLTPMKADMNYKAPTIKTMESTCGKTDPYEEKLVCGHGDGIVLTNQKCWKGISLSSEFEELLNAKEDALLLLEASGDQQTLLFNHLNDLRQENKQHLHLSMVRECKDALCESPNRSCCEREGNYSERLVQIHKSSDRILDGESSHTLLCDENIEQMNENFQEVQKLNRCQSIQTSQPTDLHVVEPFCKKLEEPNAMVPNLQGTLAVLQQECDSKNDTLSTSTRSMMLLRAENEELKNILNLIMEENIRFSKVLEGREKDSAALVEWEKETNTLTNSLMDGYHAVEDASHQIKSICNLFPERRVQIDDQTKVTAAALHENERVILDLQRRLDSARDVGIRTSMELSALKEAVVAITDAQLMENVEMSKEAAESRNLHEKMHTIHKLEEKLKHQEDDLIMANRRANASFIALNWLLLQSKALEHNNEGSNTSKIMHEMGIPSENISKWIQSNELSEATSYIHSVTLHIADLEKEVHELRLALSSKENMTVGKTLKDESYAELEGNTFQAEVGCLIASCIEDIGNSVSFLASDVEDVICATRQWIQDLIEDVSDIKGIVTELKYCNVKIQDLRSAFSYLENPSSTGRNKRQTSYSLFEKQFMAISDQMTLLNMKHSCAAQCVAERINEPQALLLKFSEAQETMREADMVLNALLQGYKTATHQVSKWKQKGQALTAENSTLLMQVQELKDSVLLKEEESKQLEEHFDMLITEVVGALSSFEHSMIQMRGASDEFNVLFSGFIAFVRELLLSVNVLRFCPESMIAAIGENTFAIFVLSHCFSDFLTGNAALHRTDSHRCYHTSRFELDGFEETFKLSAKEMRRPEGAHDAGNGAQENKLDALDAKDGMVIVGEDDQTSFRSKDDVVDDAKHRVDKNLSIYPPQYAIRIKELETEKEALVRDVQLMQEIVNHQLINLEEISQGLISLEKVSDCEKLIDGCAMGQMLKTNDATSVDLSCFHIINEVNSKSRMEVNHGSSLTPWNKSAKNQADCITQDESSVLVDFQNIKNQFTKLLDTLSKRKEGRHIILSQRSSNQNQGHDSHKFSRLCISANCLSSSELCRPLVQALVMLEAKLHPLADRIGSVGLGLDGTHYMLEKLFGDICKFERQTYIYEEKLSESDKQKNSLVSESFQLSSGLGRRDAVMEGLLFDLRLLQESTSNVKGRKDEAEEVSSTLRPTRNSHAVRATDIDGILNRQQRLQNYLTDKEAALESLQCDFVQTQEAMELLANENAELRILLDDLYQKKHDFEEQLVEQNEVIECLKKEVLSLSSTVEQKVINSVRDSEDQLKMVISERDLLLKEVAAISHQLEASLALAEENEAIAIEARQVSELSKIHAEQKEEEARVLEQSVEELEHTINMLEKKVYEMSSEVERQKLTREDLELEMQDLKLRLLKPQTVTGDMDNESSSNPEEGRDSIVLRHVEERGNELLEAKRCIQRLEKEKADQAEKYKSYISELLFHSEAQASQYQEKYKALEAMAFDAQHSIHLEDLAANRRERSSVRTRGSGSPFKCISSLVNQMNSEKDHELFVARTRMKELEGLAANRQKEVCVLNARLAIAESMTHDVIRDLLGVKLDLSTYVNELDDEVVQKLAEAVHKQSEEVRSKEQEILNLKSHLDDLIEERARLIEENNQKKCEVLDSQLRVEQLKQRQQLLTAQNELLQMDKQNLKKKVEEMDEVLKNCGSQDFHQLIHHQSKNKENRPLRIRNNELDQRHKDSEKRPSRVKDELPLNRFGRSGKSSAFNLDLQRRP